jgi:hypothetical protein
MTEHKAYRFYLYRDSFYPGPDNVEQRVLTTDDPERTARELLKGAIDRVDWSDA